MITYPPPSQHFWVDDFPNFPFGGICWFPGGESKNRGTPHFTPQNADHFLVGKKNHGFVGYFPTILGFTPNIQVISEILGPKRNAQHISNAGVANNPGLKRSMTYGEAMLTAQRNKKWRKKTLVLRLSWVGGGGRREVYNNYCMLLVHIGYVSRFIIYTCTCFYFYIYT